MKVAYTKQIQSFANQINILKQRGMALVYVRNICAHHARLWNRVFGIRPLMPRHPRHPFITLPTSGTQSVYFVLAIIRYILNNIDPRNTFVTELKTLLSKIPTVNPSAMGFSQGWDNEPLWR